MALDSSSINLLNSFCELIISSSSCLMIGLNSFAAIAALIYLSSAPLAALPKKKSSSLSLPVVDLNKSKLASLVSINCFSNNFRFLISLGIDGNNSFVLISIRSFISIISFLIRSIKN